MIDINYVFFIKVLFFVTLAAATIKIFLGFVGADKGDGTQFGAVDVAGGMFWWAVAIIATIV